ARPKEFAHAVDVRARELAATSDRPIGAEGIVLEPLVRVADEGGLRYPNLDVAIDRGGRTATFTLRAPAAPGPSTPEAIVAAGAQWWPLALARELDDAILLLRTNEADIGTWVMRTQGDPDVVLAIDRILETR